MAQWPNNQQPTSPTISTSRLLATRRLPERRLLRKTRRVVGIQSLSGGGNLAMQHTQHTNTTVRGEI